jgi:hypothetical protein
VQPDQTACRVGDVGALRTGGEMMPNPDASSPLVNTEVLHAPEGSGGSNE